MLLKWTGGNRWYWRMSFYANFQQKCLGTSSDA